MFNIFKNELITNQFYKILEDKLALIDNSKTPEETGQIKHIDWKKHLNLVNAQIELRGFLNKEYTEQTNFLFKQMTRQIAKQPGVDVKTNKIQTDVIKQFLDNDLHNLVDECNALKNILLAESEALKSNNINEYKRLLNEEGVQIKKLIEITSQKSDLEKRFARAYGHGRQIDFNEFLSNMKHKMFKYYLENLRKNPKTKEKEPYKMLSPIDVKKIPGSGPVIIASRHYAADIDGPTLLNAIPRRTNILAAVEWVNTPMLRAFRYATHAHIGEIPMNKPNTNKISPYFPDATPMKALKQMIFLLNAGELLVYFPEGEVSVTIVQKDMKGLDELLPAKEGFVATIELAQEELKKKIPVIPTGIIIDRENKTAQAAFGEPIFYDNPQKDWSKESKEEHRKNFGKKVMADIKVLSRLP